MACILAESQGDPIESGIQNTESLSVPVYNNSDRHYSVAYVSAGAYCGWVIPLGDNLGGEGCYSLIGVCHLPLTPKFHFAVDLVEPVVALARPSMETHVLLDS